VDGGGGLGEAREVLVEGGVDLLGGRFEIFLEVHPEDFS
jgi:hypothetical protein